MRHPIRAALPHLLALTTLLSTALVSGSVHAAPDQRPGGLKIRLHGDFDFLSLYHYNPDGDGDSYTGGGFGIGRTSLQDGGVTPNGGLLHPRPVWTLGVGVLLLDERLNVGAKFSFAVDGIQTFPGAIGGLFGGMGPGGIDDFEGRATTVSGQFVPYVRWIFLPGKRFRPYAEGHLGLGGGRLIGTFEGRQNAGATTVSGSGSIGTIYPIVGAAGGVHIFIIDAFSFDAGLSLDYLAVHVGSRTSIRSETGGMTVEIEDEQGWEKSNDVVNLAVTTGLSVWF